MGIVHLDAVLPYTSATDTQSKMQLFAFALVLSMTCQSLALPQPLAQQATSGQGDQRIFGNLLGAAQGAVQGFLNPGLYNNHGHFHGGYYPYGGYNPYGYGGFGGYGGYGQGFGYGYNQYWG